MSTTASAEKEKLQEASELYNAMGCIQRITQVTGVSLVAGGLMGAIQASWGEASHIGVKRSSKWAMINHTAKNIGRSSAMFGVVGAMFAAGECASQTYRGENRSNGWQNQAFGGACAGLAMGALTRSVGGAVGSAIGLGFLSGLISALPAGNRF